MKYNSPPTTIEQQLKIIESRGMIISDREQAEAFLNKVSYYRFSGYALHFEYFKERNRTHQFKEGTAFDAVIDLHSFDSKLRSLLFDAIGEIEVAFRTQLCLLLSLRTRDAHWPLNANLFQPWFKHAKFLEEITKEVNRSREIFVDSYKKKYTTPKLPASWMLIEIVSFSSWSRVYSSLKDPVNQKEIADYFNLTPYILKSWIHAMTVLRNLCAHHARIWNATLTIEPQLTRRMKRAYPVNSKQRTRISLMLDILCELLKPLGEYENFITSLNVLLKEHPSVPYDAMGLKKATIDIEKGVRG